MRRGQGALSLFPSSAKESKGLPQGTPVATGPKRRQVSLRRAPPPIAPPRNLAPSTYFPEPLTPITSSALGAAIAPNPVPSLRRSPSARLPSRRAEPPVTRPPCGPRTARRNRSPPAQSGCDPMRLVPTGVETHPTRAPFLSGHAPWPGPRPRRSLPAAAPRRPTRTRRPTGTSASLRPFPAALASSPLCGKWSPPQAGERAPRPSIWVFALASLHRPSHRPDPPPLQ